MRFVVVIEHACGQSHPQRPNVVGDLSGDVLDDVHRASAPFDPLSPEEEVPGCVLICGGACRSLGIIVVVPGAHEGAHVGSSQGGEIVVPRWTPRRRLVVIDHWERAEEKSFAGEGAHSSGAAYGGVAVGGDASG